MKRLYSKIGNDILHNFKVYNSTDFIKRQKEFLKVNIMNMNFKSRPVKKNSTILKYAKELYKLGRLADLSDLEIEIISLLMCREWISQQINSVTLTLQVFSGKETNYFSQSAHLKELMALDDKWRLEAQQLSRDYTYTSSEYFD